MNRIKQPDSQFLRGLAVLILFLSVALSGYAQDRDLLRLYEQYAGKAGFALDHGDANLEVDADWNLGEFLDRLEAFYILKFDRDGGSLSDLRKFEDKFYGLLDKKGFQPMMEIGGEERVEIFKRKDKQGVATDFILVAAGDEESTYIWAAGK